MFCVRRAASLTRALLLGASVGLGAQAGLVEESSAADKAPMLVYSTKQWEGEYGSTPSGVKTVPVHSAVRSVRADGSDATTMVDLGAVTEYPKFSLDGKWLYFQSNASGHFQVYRCRPDGKDVQNLSAAAKLGEKWHDAFGYALSGDGRKMVYTAHDGANGQVVICNADGSGAKFLAPELGYTYMAALDRAGDRVVFSGPREYRLMIAELPTGKPRILTPDLPASYVPQFTLDGKAIVFVRIGGDIYRVWADGGDPRRLTEGNKAGEFKLAAGDEHGSSDGPDISPDGKQIAYIAVKDGVSQVCAMDLDGGNQRQITRMPANCGRAQFSPDSSQLAFVSFVGKYPQLFVVDAGGDPRQLTHADEAAYYIDWQP